MPCRRASAFVGAHGSGGRPCSVGNPAEKEAADWWLDPYPQAGDRTRLSRLAEVRHAPSSAVLSRSLAPSSCRRGGSGSGCRCRAGKRHALPLRLRRPAKTLVRLLREALTCSCACRSPGFSILRLQVWRSDLGRSRTHALWEPAPSKPLETTGERGANGASVRRVAPRTDFSNARS